MRLDRPGEVFLSFMRKASEARINGWSGMLSDASVDLTPATTAIISTFLSSDLFVFPLSPPGELDSPFDVLMTRGDTVSSSIVP